MGRQRERHSHEQIKATLEHSLGRPFGPGDFCSGGQIENFREGWALDIMRGAHPGRAHYFRRREDDISMTVAKCGATGSVRWMYGPGNYERCARCKNAMARRAG